jgi:peptidoglycan/LPS O-acetylase OafA/YrhL
MLWPHHPRFSDWGCHSQILETKSMDLSPPREVENPQVVAESPGVSDAPVKPSRIHLGFIDALRALAALYVVVGHAFYELDPYQKDLMAAYPKVEKVITFLSIALFRYGHFAVAVFIVISGFCLMLPLARNDKVQMESIGRFIGRRAWRILPPYYVALAISLTLMIIVPGMNNVFDGEWANAIPAFQTWTIISHLLLFHHWSDQWIVKIDPPLWSIGVEWQMYFLMPLFFLPLLKKFGRIKMILITAILGIVLTYVRVGWLTKWPSYFHFIALFAAGMATAQICFSPSAECRRLRQHLPGSQCFLVLFVLVAALIGFQTRKSWQAIPFIHFLGTISWNHLWLMEYLVAACFCSLLISICQEVQLKPVRWIKRILHWVPLVFIGHFSYSLYLIHDPILRLVCTAGEHFHFNALSQYIVLFTFGVPFAIFCGYLLYLAVERHFIQTLPVNSR